MNRLTRLTLHAAAMLAMIFASLAQQPVTQGPIVKQIDVQFVGQESISKERVLANLATQVGQPYSEQAVEEDIRSLYATGTLANVRMFGEPVQDGVKVTVLLQGRPIIAEVLIEGAQQISQSRVRREVSVKPGQSLSEEKLEDDRRKILKLYQDRNYSDVDIQYKVEDLPQNKSRVIFSITEGPKLIVNKITFVGNYSVKDKDLRAAMKTKVRNLLWFFDKSGRLTSTQLEDDRAALHLLYQNRGFADAEIADVSTQPLPKRKDGVEIVVTIQEGVQYRVNSVTLEGVNIVPQDQLRGVLGMREGSLFTPSAPLPSGKAGGLVGDLNAIRTFYGQRGYIEANPVPQVTPAGQGSVDINYKIDEGVQSYVNLVNIQGNSRTKDKVIRRELAIKPGEVYDTTLVDVSKARLENLQYFSNITMSPSDTVVPGRKDLNVILEEKRTGSFNFGAGFSTIDSLIGFAELQQTNFDLFDWPHFVGGGQRFRIRLQYGLQRQDYVISWTEPWFLGYKLSLGVEGYYREANFLSTVYNQSNLGAAVSLRKPITNFLSADSEYRIEQIRIFDVQSNNVGQFIQDSAGTYVRSAVAGGLVWDSRDDLRLTRRGEYVRLGGFLAGGFLGGTVQDTGITLDASKFFLLPWDTILMLKGQLAVTDTWGGATNNGLGVPIFDRLYLGGANNMRGFDYRDVGPKDSDGNPIGGNSLAYGTIEWSFPIITRIRGSLFTDWGFVNPSAGDFSGSNVNADIGFGVRVELPIGPIRVDYGIPVIHDQFNGGTGKFNFNVGYQF
ncbi:MAG: outer membrane protein assembly factor BamA [Terrimicrobiaceae bacterium]|nr:outer membrane protein assembly factor BamA [Terrimicrobiaceae bacterium]